MADSANIDRDGQAVGVDPERLKHYSFQLFSQLAGAVTAGMIHLGDQLGLYSAMRTHGQPMSTDELAAATGLHERWIREWAYNQIAAKMIDSDRDGKISLSPEAAAVLASPDHPAFGMGMFHRLPQTMRALDDVRDSFRTGIGHDYDSHGPEGAIGIERSFEPWNRANLIPVVLPALAGVVEKLDRGAVVADVGCGAGSAALLLADRFPNSTVCGYDISTFALQRAEQKRSASGLTNVSFVDPTSTPLPTNQSVDLILTFDCIHDMAHPQAVIADIRRAVKHDGTWLLVDIKALDTFDENNQKNPMAALMYGISVLSCMSSAMSQPNGAGLGTLGLSERKAREMAEAAGFTQFQRLRIDHSVNAFYEIRP